MLQVSVLSWASFWSIVFGWVLAGYAVTVAYMIFAGLIYLLKSSGIHWMAVSVIL